MKTLAFVTIFILASFLLELDGVQADVQNPEIWLKRKEAFYANTSFDLSEDNIRLLGGKFSDFQKGHLPFWFNFELYKKVFKKSYGDEKEELAREHVYIKSCIRLLKARVLYRITNPAEARASETLIAGETLVGSKAPIVERDADMFYEEKIPRESNLDSTEDEESDEIRFTLEFELENELIETPIEKAIRLVREELDQVESRNQLEHYLMEFDEEFGSAISGVNY